MFKLGPQGRSVLQKLSDQQRYSSVIHFQEPTSKAQNDVNLLLSTLSNNTLNYSENDLLSYVVHYFPKTKNKDNLKLLTKAFLLNKTIFCDGPDINLKDSYMVIEAIKATFESKIKISEPTLHLTHFYNAIVEEIYQLSIENWKKILVITGILLSQPLYLDNEVPETKRFFKQTYTTLINLNHEMIIIFLKNMETNPFELNALISIATSCSLQFFSESQKIQLPNEVLLHLTIDLLFKSPYGLALGNVKQLSESDSPVLKHLSRLSFLIENCLTSGVSFPVLDAALDIILDFSIGLHNKIVNNRHSWDYMKNILFSIVIIFQGFASFSLNIYNKLKPIQLSRISNKILLSLYHLNFIIEKIGTGGFQAYNFVYLTALDGLLQYSLKSAEELGKLFVGSIKLSEFPQYHVDSSKILFTLIYFETLSQKCSKQYYDSVISPFVQFFIQNPKIGLSPESMKIQRSIIEASHSVILSTYSEPKNAHIIAQTAIPYLRTVLSQFPTFLSAHQLRMAVEAITKSVSPVSPAYQLDKENLREIFHTLYITILNTKPGLSLSTDQQPSTTRSALIHSIIAVVPYIPVTHLESWLQTIWELLELSTSQEFSLCENAFWSVISDGLDIQRSSIAIQWWYNRSAVINPKL